MTFRSCLRLAVLPAAAFAMLLLAMPQDAAAESVTFVLQNSHPNAVEIEFCSQDRDHSWPGGGEAFVMDGAEPVSFPLSCEAGETICYGAWVSGDQETYWGAGPDCAEPCDSCCTVCDGGTTEVMELGE
ncbi:hypothetical protein ACFOGJ_15970 [Marinibaculum pumilum]|uniref:Uncharacterized protein n=1 Tax=Marinibaculum pumilum TaxID=1766165 RepID=A0ABV7L2A9_9PROT